MILGVAGWVCFRLISVLNSNTRWPVWENLGPVFAQGFQGRPRGAPGVPYSGRRGVPQALPESTHLRWDAESIVFTQNCPWFRIPGKLSWAPPLQPSPTPNHKSPQKKGQHQFFLPSFSCCLRDLQLSPPWQLGAVNCAWVCFLGLRI